MTESEAEKYKQFLEGYCKRHSLWFEIFEKYKPHKDVIEIKISIKVKN